MDEISVVYASDENFAPYTLVSIYSMFVNNENVPIHVYILNNGISEYNINSIMKLLNNFPHNKISFISIDNLEDMLNLSDIQKEYFYGISITAYARLFLGSLLPEHLEKVIYFDGDSLIVNSITELWDINLDDYWCAGVIDNVPFAYKEVIGFDNDDKYINSGMLYINLAEWRKNNLEEKFLEYIVNNKDRFYSHDQGVINVFMKNHLLFVHPKFNYQSPFHGKDYDTTLKWFGVNYDFYSKEIMEEAGKNPVFIHFSGGSIERPWSNPNTYYYDTYNEYVNQLEDYDTSRIYKITGSLSLMGKLYVYVSNNSLGYFLMKITPRFFAVWLKNFIVTNQFNKINKVKSNEN